MVWLIVFAVLLLLAILPLGASVSYDSDGPVAKLIAGPIRIQLFPVKKKEKVKKPAKKKEPVKKQKEPSAPAKSQEKTGGKITDFLPLVWTVLDFLVDFRKKIRVNHLELKLIMAGGDPCDLATNYGKAWAALGNLMPQLERLFVIKKRDLEVECDFTSSETLVWARLDITITLGRLLSLGVRYGIRGLREFLQIMKLRKGGN